MGATWKHAERKVAEILDGRRVGCTGKATADVLAGDLAIEVKHRKALPQWLKGALEQAEGNAPDGRIPVVVLHEKHQEYGRSLAIVSLADLRRLTEGV